MLTTNHSPNLLLEKLALEREFATRLAELEAARASSDNAPGLDRAAADIRALRDTLSSATTLRDVSAIKQQATPVMRLADATIQANTVRGQDSAVSGGQQAAQVALQARRFMDQSSGPLEQRGRDFFGWGRLYGVDLSEHEKRERDLKRREQDLMRSGDMRGALGTRIERLDNQIAAGQALLDSPNVPEHRRADIERRIAEARRQREETARQQEALQGRSGLQETRREATEAVLSMQRYDGSRAAMAEERMTDIRQFAALSQPVPHKEGRQLNPEPLKGQTDSAAAARNDTADRDELSGAGLLAQAKAAATPAARAGVTPTAEGQSAPAAPPSNGPSPTERSR